MGSAFRRTAGTNLFPGVHRLALERVRAELHDFDLHAVAISNARECRPGGREGWRRCGDPAVAQRGDGGVDVADLDAEMGDACRLVWPGGNQLDECVATQLQIREARRAVRVADGIRFADAERLRVKGERRES